MIPVVRVVPEPPKARRHRLIRSLALAISCASLAVPCSTAATPAPAGPAPAEPAPATAPSSTAASGRFATEFRAGVYALAADSMEGRGLGTTGILRAADWIERGLRSRGMKPAFGKSYRQPFDIKTGVVPIEGNRLDRVPDSAWVPLGFSNSGSFSGEIAFLGYGIDAPPLGYRELEGMDLKGKIALMLRYEPQERDSSSRFDGKKPSRWSALRYKVLQARERGAAAIVFVTGPLQDEGKDKIPPLRNDGPESPAGIPVIQVKTSVAQEWLQPAGIDLERFQKEVDRDLTPRSVASTGVRISGTVALRPIFVKTENIAGVIPGRGALEKEYVVIGGHYDHLGYGGERSTRPNVRAIHNGADDNASGAVGAMMIGEELSRSLAQVKNRRSILVALFSGEEVGLAGSSYFVQHPPIPVGSMAAMINLDMVGRLREDRLVALGSDTAPEWKDLIRRAATDASLHVTSKGDGYGPSDQTSFYAAGVPVLHLFTGAHEQYHSPDDKPETVNPEGASQVISFAVSLGGDLARAPSRPRYVRASSGPAMGGDSRGYGAYLGTIPDYSAMESSEGGVLLADVRPGGPADLAGIRGKDRIVGMAGTRIENLYDMTYALQDNKPGETIDVVVIRGETLVRLRATLGERGATGAAARDLEIRAGRPFDPPLEAERHLSGIRQLTFGGENAEAYWSPDGRKLIFQATPRGGRCDQQYVLDLETGDVRMVSSGKGRTTCGYFDYPEGKRILFSSTHEAGDSCPPPPDRSHGYVWAIYDSYDIYEARTDGSGLTPLVRSPGYDAEATGCPRGGKIVFTSTRDGDLDLYVRDDAGAVRRVTDTPGYDGGAFFSPDCSEIVWRASRPQGAALEEYRQLLKKGLIRPRSLELFVMKADGTGARQLTKNGAANFCPTFHADGNRILYSSNAGAADAREFDLWMTDKRGGTPERITFSPGFDGFPHVSPDGKWLVWSSNRAHPGSHETNLFVARWAD
ncbi:MAG TPA: M28 family peptidase [Candidatus Eisenbacteria bacterium]